MSIHKITIGADYKAGMSYKVDTPIRGTSFVISDIKKVPSTGHIQVYITDDKGNRLVWKEFNNQVPIHIEYDIS